MEVFLIACMLLGGFHASRQKPKVIYKDNGKVLRDERIVKSIESDTVIFNNVDYVGFYR